MSYKHPMNAQVTRAARKEINPRLHRAGLPTLGSCDTLAQYRATLTKAQKVVFADLTRTQVPAEAKPAQKWTCACTSVREHIRESKDGHAAQTARLFAEVA
jgi:hypothetical protein